ncbi:MAG: hypothetical protein C7B43_08460 [Sulfobacillus benefaciens]|uniref:Uncharacterized protein n=1 Tax=Sulfobacillus benefaciens TaxID=453960 RepID=A0A2T2X4I1_9FIRM|nr:MAG: hypothetical protein C7B43_08460 [Sulfobacillus benefaciens]HBQ96597.1 hypothetical protein [Sulfobacillus sp.]
MKFSIGKHPESWSARYGIMIQGVWEREILATARRMPAIMQANSWTTGTSLKNKRFREIADESRHEQTIHNSKRRVFSSLKDHLKRPLRTTTIYFATLR